MKRVYTVKKGQRGLWIIRDPYGNALESVSSKAYAVERAEELTAEAAERNDPPCLLEGLEESVPIPACFCPRCHPWRTRSTRRPERE